MAGNEVIESHKRKYIRQPPSVPFLWEERPGIAKKDWRPRVSSVTSATLALPPPVKFIASVPFNWEETPGKPLACLSQPPMESGLATLSPPPVQYQSPSDYESGVERNAGYDNHGKKGMFDFDIESFSFETDGSDSSAAPSLLANCLVPSVAVSSAVPVPESPSTNDINDQLETPSSPASDSESSASSYATGISSLTGVSFLECLFPLYAPTAGYLATAAHSIKGSLTPSELQNRSFDRERGSIITAIRTPTLGELIMMSRRRSCQRKAIQIGKHNSSMEFMNTKYLGCCIFGTGITMIEGFKRGRRLARLKLI